MIPDNRAEIGKSIQIKRADGVWVDVTEFVKSVRVFRGDVSSVGSGSSGVDTGVLQCEIVLKNDTENKFSPLIKTSPWNQLPDGTYSPLLWSNREAKITTETESPVVLAIKEDLTQGTLTNVEVNENGELVLSVGVDVTYSEDAQADFQAGTLTGVVATVDGSLVLAKEGEDFIYTETTQADFSSGTLTDVVATSAGDLELWRPDVYGAFDDSLALVGKDDTTVAPLSGHVATLRPGEGRFGGAVAVEEGTTNLFSAENSSFEGSTIGNWTANLANAVIITGGWHGAKAVQVTATARNGRLQQRIDGTLVNLNDAVTLSAYAKLPNGVAPMDVTLSITIADVGYRYVTKQITSDKWTRLSVTTTLDTLGSGVYAQLFAGGLNSDTYGTVIWDAVQLEKKPFATSFVDGTRAAGKLTYPVSVLPVPAGTLSLWVYFPDLSIMTSFASIVGTHSVAAPGCFFLRRTGSYLGVVVGDDSGSTKGIQAPYPSVGWHHVTVVWGSGTIRLYLDGIQVSSGSATLPSTWRGSLGIGARPDGSHPWNGLIDELLILPYAASEEEIQRWYAQTLPLRRASSGTRTTPVLDLLPVGTAAGSSIAWNATTPEGTSVTVETNLSLDGGVTWQGWQQVTNGGAIPGITQGTDLSNAKMLLRENLTTSDTTVTPQLHDVTVDINSAYKPSGMRIAPPIPLDTAGIAKGSSISWQATNGVSVETSLDGQTWDTPTNGGEIPGIAGQDLAGKSLYIRETLTTSDITQTPSLDRLSVNITAGYLPSGSRVSPVYPLDKAKTVMESLISWIGSGDFTIETSVNSGPWQVATVDNPIPGIEEGMNLAGGTLQTRITLTTTDGNVTPAVSQLNWEVQGQERKIRPLFAGYLGDSISTDGHTVSVLCRDPSKLLQDCYIESLQEYGSETGVPAEEVLQQLLDNNLGAGVVTLYCPVSPGQMITNYAVEYVTLWEAMQNLVRQFGWFLGHFWDDQGNLVLTLLEPPRTKDITTPDLILDYMDDYYTRDLEISDANVRNVIIVTYRDKATNERKRVILEDPVSIAQFGRRAMIIEEADTSQIDTEDEARRMGSAALEDLKQIAGLNKIEMPFVPTVDIFTGIRAWDPRISSSPEFYGVQSVEHVLDFDGNRFRTNVVVSGKVIGGNAKWLDMEVRPGSAGEAINAGEILQGILDAGSAAIVAKGNGGYVVIDKNGQRFISADGAITIEFNTETGEGFFSGRVVGAVYGE